MARHHHVAAILLSVLFVLGSTCVAPARSAPATSTDSTMHATQPSGVWYEIFVRSWYDTNSDGIGDLNGVTAKLDYLKSLGVSGIWLMPINPSPSYHGYDITNYYAINPQYGSMADFERLLAEAHRRGIKVIIDLVINHSSDQHPWFKAALDPADPHHDWYQWAGPGTDLDSRSAAGAKAWHAAGAGHYLGIFGRDMPDLDYDNPAVRKEMLRVGQFWLRKGVDGFRLDAARHIYVDFPSDADNPQALAKNLAWWSQFRLGMRDVKADVWIVGEVTQDATAGTAAQDATKPLAPWFKAIDTVFDFPLATQLIESAKSERAGNLGALLARTDAAYRKATGKSGMDAPFLSNHDQNRVMSQLDGNPQHMRMAAAMLLTLPGQPFLYYGEELGLRGVKPDPDLRTPMRWNRSTRAPGETTWRTAHDAAAVSVETEQADPDSLLHFYTTLIHWRSEIGALRDGAIQPHAAANAHLVAYALSDANSRVLVVHNLSGQPQTLPLDGQLFRAVLKQSRPGITLHDGKLQLPPYTTAILH